MGNTTKSTMFHYVQKMFIKWATPFGYITRISQSLQNISERKESLRAGKNLDGKVNMIEE